MIESADPDIPHRQTDLTLSPNGNSAPQEGIADQGIEQYEFRRIALLAARLVSAPAAEVSLLSSGKLEPAGAFGSNPELMSAFAPLREDVLTSTAESIVRNLPNTVASCSDEAGPAISGFYAGVALTEQSGAALGVISVYDVRQRPKGLTPEEVESLSALAEQAVALVQMSQSRSELRASFALHRAMMNANPQVPWIADPEGRIIDFNQRWLDLTGMSRAEALGLGWSKAPHPEDLPGMLEAWQASISSGEPYDVEHRIRLIDGTYRWMRSRAVPQRRSDGNIIRWLGSTEDIHERKVAQAAFLSSDERLRLAVDATGLGTWDWDLREGTLTWDSRCRQLFGLISNRPVSFERDFSAAVFPDDRNSLTNAISIACQQASGGGFEAEYRVRGLDDGEVRWVASKGRCFFEDNEAVRMIGTVRDITAQKKAIEAVRERDLQIKLAQEAADVGVWEWDLATDRFILDKKSLEMHGLTSTRDGCITQADWASVVEPADAERAREAYYKSLATGVLYDCVFKVTRADGEQRWINGLARPIYDESGSAIKLVGLNVDITRLKVAEFELVRAHENLVRASRLSAVGAIATTFAHELNQPLAALNNYMVAAERIAASSVDLPAALVDVHQRAAAQVKRIGAIVKRIRQYTLSGAVNREVVNIREMISEAWSATTLNFDYNLDFRLICPEDLTAQVDQVQLTQVLINLFRNSVEAMSGRSGSVLEAQANRYGDKLCFEISDNGPGISQAIMGRLFEVFQTTKKTGTGLGLPLCRTLIEMHGGHLSVESSPESGTKFFIDIPMD